MSLGWPEIVIIIVLALIVFGGGRKFAEMGKGLGEGIRNFKGALKGEDQSTEKDKDSGK